MYFNDYDDYMRNVLGYNRNEYNNPCYGDTYNCYKRTDDRVMCEMEEMYPEIYKRINPIVCRMCQNVSMPISPETLEQMTDQIYTSINADDINVYNINIETRDTNQAKQVNNRQIDSKDIKQETRDSKTYQESRSPRPNNPLLRDLIRILLLNQLIRRPNQRPPFPGPGMGPRPPFPGPAPRPMPWNRDVLDNNYYNY